MGIVHFLMLFAFLLMQCLHFSCGTNTSSCLEIERQSLLLFRKGLRDASNRLLSWVGDDCCSWQGVACNNYTSHVVKLDLRTPNHQQAFSEAHLLFGDDQYVNYWRTFYKSLLVGEVNPSLLNLKRLEYLDLSNNNFSGSIPKFFGSFKELRYLNLSQSGFFGKVPHHLGNLSNLQYLDLSHSFIYNGPYGSLIIDGFSWVSTLSSLKHLDLSWVEGFGTNSDWFVALISVPSLKVLILSSCGIVGIHPSSYVNFTSVNSIDLSYNRIYSTIPIWLSNITGLLHLNLGVNFFHGPLPESFGMLSPLTFLDISENSFNTSIPDFFCNLSSLVYLDLNFNKFSGSIPPSLGQLSKLEALYMGSNQLSGSIPTSLGKLSKARVLYMDNNQLSGSIPTSIGHLSSLQYLDVSYNSLVDNLYEHHFTELKMLETLVISSTSLGFNVSLLWVPPFQLRNIDMSSCGNLGPRFPHWLQNQRHIECLNISKSRISDLIPPWFDNVSSSIQVLDLSHNQISGQLPKLPKSVWYFIMSSNRFEGPLSGIPLDLKILDLSSNLLTGRIQMLLCKMTSMGILNLSGNKISGRLPSCLWRLNQLVVLDVTNNSLHGQIPSSLGSLSNLQSLHLHNNKFEGELPLSLRNLAQLKTLDLGVNSFTGIIPSWIGEELSNLKYLSLQSNLIVGQIPQQLCYLASLQLLDLARNNLTGKIPSCIGNLIGMTMMNGEPIKYDLGAYTENILTFVKGKELQYTTTIRFLTSMDLSNNNLVGEIPKGLMDLSGLKELNISGNRLNGIIPKAIGNLKQLESLDLSRNRISGPIPQSLSGLNFLSYLNLSFNQLSGHIPTGNQLQTLNTPSVYEGNDELCGVPVLKSCPGIDKPVAHGSEGSDDVDDHIWFYAGTGPGFLVGFLGVCGVLHFIESWRHAYFKFLENIFNWVALTIAIKLNWLKRKLHIGEV